jgi:hypothetical protein
VRLPLSWSCRYKKYAVSRVDGQGTEPEETLMMKKPEETLMMKKKNPAETLMMKKKNLLKHILLVKSYMFHN